MLVDVLGGRTGAAHTSLSLIHPVSLFHHRGYHLLQGVVDQSYKRGKQEKDMIVERMKERQRRRMAGGWVGDV